MLRAFCKLGESGEPRTSAEPLVGRGISMTFCGRQLLQLLRLPLEVLHIESGRGEPQHDSIGSAVAPDSAKFE